MSSFDEDKLLNHEYDGIREYDNPMPGWWKALFYLSIIYCIPYLFYFHWGAGGTSVQEDYATEVRLFNEAEAKRALSMGEISEESLMKLTLNANMMHTAKEKYLAVCATCHGAAGEGKIGPNLTDAYWIHGGDMVSIFNTIKNGVVEKGMQAWGRKLSPEQLRTVAAYVGTLRNTNAPNGKAPQGELQK